MSIDSHAVLCRDLRKQYADVVAVDGLNLEVRTGECFGLLGPNGAGKTTTIEILEGLIEPDGGAVEVLGLGWATDGARLRERIGVQLQETQLPPKLTAGEVVRLFRSFYRQGPDADAVLGIVQLEEKRDAWVSRLSGGQRQRLAVACALVGGPELLFLDEPTTGLDPQSRRSLWELVESFRAEGHSILLTTHYMEEATRLCDRVGIMDRGRIIAVGTPAELIASLGADQVVEFRVGRLDADETPGGNGEASAVAAGGAALAAPPVAEAALRALPGVTAVHEAGGAYRLTVREAHRVLPALLELLRAGDIELAALATHTATLEDVFVALTGRQLRDE
ncbi:MAG: ABC transporter ATP-binding protein [Gemmatimonadota bacterium]